MLFLAFCIVVGCVPEEKKEVLSSAVQGQIAFEQGLYDQAIEAWSKALKEEPGNDELVLKIALAFQKQARFDDSIRRLRSITKYSHAPVNAYVMLVQNLIMLQDIEEAEKILESVRQKKLEDYGLLTIEGDCKTMAGRLQAGEALYREAITMQAEIAGTYFKLAANLVAQNRMEDADDFYQQALALDKDKSPEFWLHKAEYLTLKGKIAEAEVALKEALKADSESLFIKLKTTQLYKAMDKYDAIVDLFMDNDGLPENESVQKIVAEALLNTKQMDVARPILQQYAHSIDHDWMLLWGKYHLLDGYSNNAIGYLERALEYQKDEPRASYLLALAYMAADKFNLAQQTLIQLLSLVPDYPNAELALADIYYKKGNYDLSIDHLNRVIAGNPANFRAYLVLGNCFHSLGRFDEAELAFQKVLKLNRRSLNARFFLSATKEKQGRNEEAISLLKEILEKKPQKVDAIMRLAGIYVRNKQPETAISTVEKLIDAYPENGYLQMILGGIYKAIDEPDQAIHYYRLALKNNPKLDAAYENIVTLEKNNQKKIELLLDATRHLPNSDRINTMLADLYLREGKPESATEIVERLYLSDKSNPYWANNLAWLYLESGIQLIQAFELASFAYEADNRNADFAHTLGVAYHKKGMLKQAEWYLRESLTLASQETSEQTAANGQEGIFRYHLALLLLDTGNSDEARDMLETSLKMQLPSRYADAASKLLRTEWGKETSEF